jgi:hypothetical protein
MKSVSVPLVKCKTSDLSDVNNYRAIAISTVVSNLLESVLSCHVKAENYFDNYQFSLLLVVQFFTLGNGKEGSRHHGYVTLETC